MSTPDPSQDLADRGYTVVRGVLDPVEVEYARERCGRLLSGAGAKELTTSGFLAEEFLAGIVLRDRVLAAVRMAVGPSAVLYPSCTARKDIYVPWHVDSAFTGPGAAYVWEPGFAHVQCGLYLQDNTPETGGGIDVVRASHLMAFDGYGRLPADFETAAHTVGASSLCETVDTRAGDLVVWHARLLHRSTVALGEPRGEKFGVFFSYAREHLRDNHRFLCRIAEDSVRTMNGVSRTVPRLAEIARLRYPADFPAWFVKEAEHAGTKVVTL
ncbi:phytanoyl-CoA dioxygenase family protein [Sphaerisporangium aureirubrum]|uniref:Phytanoyl-CoA dioxygenase family protein n=1 Tax=Sphaerisporangium aureirubrum TaxID=1544736 RepID=A0ABW1NTT5_9ACTN